MDIQNVPELEFTLHPVNRKTMKVIFGQFPGLQRYHLTITHKDKNKTDRFSSTNKEELFNLQPGAEFVIKVSGVNKFDKVVCSGTKKFRMEMTNHEFQNLLDGDDNFED